MPRLRRTAVVSSALMCAVVGAILAISASRLPSVSLRLMAIGAAELLPLSILAAVMLAVISNVLLALIMVCKIVAPTKVFSVFVIMFALTIFGISGSVVWVLGSIPHVLLWRALAHTPESAWLPNICGLWWPGDNSCWEPACGVGRDGAGALLIYTPWHRNVTALWELPEACMSIVASDVVGTDAGKECGNFCKSHLGEASSALPFLPVCSHRHDTRNAPLFKACSKVATAQAAWMVRQPGIQAALGLLYLVIGLIISGAERWASSTAQYAPPEEAVGMLVIEASTAEDPEESGLVAPSQQQGLPADVPFERGWLDMPLCMFPSRTDAERARWQLRSKAVFIVLDPVTDIMAIASFAAQGQPWWMLLSILAVGFHGDVWQLRGLRAIHRAWQQGFPTQELLEVQMLEGGVEGTMSGAIVLYSVFATNPEILGWKTLVMRSASAVVSLLLAMPGAQEAEDLLEHEGLEINDYYAQETAKRQFSKVVKYSATMQILGFTAAAALGKRHPWFVGICFSFISLPMFFRLFELAPPQEEKERLAVGGVVIALVCLLFAAYMDWS